MAFAKRPYEANQDLLDRLDEWLATHGGTATFEEMLASGNHLLFAAFLLRGFRKAASEAVFDRFKFEARKHGFLNVEPSASAFFYMIDRIADAWLATDQQKADLLGVAKCWELDAMREAPYQDIPPETLERGAILLDIFIYLGAIFPGTQNRGRLGPLAQQCTALRRKVGASDNARRRIGSDARSSRLPAR